MQIQLAGGSADEDFTLVGGDARAGAEAVDD